LTALPLVRAWDSRDSFLLWFVVEDKVAWRFWSWVRKNHGVVSNVKENENSKMDDFYWKGSTEKIVAEVEKFEVN